MHHNAMPRKASIRKSRPAPLSSANSPTNGLEVAFRSLISFLQTGKMGRCWSFWCEWVTHSGTMIAKNYKPA